MAGTSMLSFPDVDSVCRAIIHEAVPRAMSLASVAAVHCDGRVLVLPTGKLSVASQKALRTMGVTTVKKNGYKTRTHACWQEMVPLVQCPIQIPKVVLFELSDSTAIPRLSADIQRLNGGRQTFRLEEDGRAFLLVESPPSHTVLKGADSDGLTAFQEASPGVWIQVGYAHPLSIAARPGKVLLVRPEDWREIDAAPFAAVDAGLSFVVDGSSTWKEAALPFRMVVPLRLAADEQSRGGEDLWVLRGDAVSAITKLVSNFDDRMLGRLELAVIQTGGEGTALVRVKRSKQSIPELVVDAERFRPWQHLNNLYLPSGYKLRPAIRRDVLRGMLANDESVITWLSHTGNGLFRAESVRQSAFRPLGEWVDHAVEEPRRDQVAWNGDDPFGLEPFRLNLPHRKTVEEVPEKPMHEAPRAKPMNVENVEAPLLVKVPEPIPVLMPVSVAERTPDETERLLMELEAQFVELTCPLEDGVRTSMWRKMAPLNAALARHADAAICWSAVLWQEGASSSVVQEWMAAEKCDPEAAPTLSIDPTLAAVRSVAVWLIGVGCVADSGRRWASILADCMRFMEKHDRLLPVRTAWLAWLAACRMSGDDVLSLARVRDRLLARLFTGGLFIDIDVAAFMRFSSGAATERFHQVRARIPDLLTMATAWACAHPTKHAGEKTGSYVGLLFAYGLSRLGEESLCQCLRAAAMTDFQSSPSAVHSILSRGFDYRIGQSINGVKAEGSLPPELLAELAELETSVDGKFGRYKIERLRERSRILEPHQRVDPYRHWHGHAMDDLSRELSCLPDIADAVQVGERLVVLVERYRATDGILPFSLARAVFDMSPRLGHEAGVAMLRRAVPTVLSVPARLADVRRGDRFSFLDQAAKLFDRSLFVAAHFDLAELLEQLVSAMEAFLAGLNNEDLAGCVDTAVGQCLRGLRKFGLHNRIDTILRMMAAKLLGGETPAEFAASVLANRSGIAPGVGGKLRSLMHVASGWCYFGRGEDAKPILDAMAAVLASSRLMGSEQGKLACSYLQAISQVSVADAFSRIEHLFRVTGNVYDTFTTNDHFSLSRLEVVEAVVLAVVNEDFAVGNELRRWLDDDEFTVRKKIHADMKEAMTW